MTLTFENILRTKYADNFLLGQISFIGTADGLEIQTWTVPNTTKPTYDEVMAMETPEIDFEYSYTRFLTEYLAQFPSLMNDVARQKNYDDAISCVSYVSSSDLEWRIEAETFSAWRDAVWNYLYAQQVLILNKSRPIPGIKQLNEELPVISWP